MQQIRIRKDELVSFKLQAANIKPNKLLPILSFLRIEIDGDFCSITKSNGQSFLVKTIPNDSEDCTFLVDENILNNYLEYVETEYIEFDVESTRITLRATGSRSGNVSPTDDSRGYPVIDVSSNEWVSLPKLVLVSAGICSNIIFDGEIAGPKSYVFIGRGFVAGCDSYIGYCQPISEAIPELVLRKDVAVCMSKMNSCSVSSNSSYDLFKEGSSLYGFIKSDQPFFELQPIFGMNWEGDMFNVNRNNIVKFNEMCIRSAFSKSIAANFTAEDNSLFLKMVDDKQDIHDYIWIKGTKGFFKFDPQIMNNLLKILPSDDCYFYQGTNRYYITDIDTTFTAVIMGII